MPVKKDNEKKEKVRRNDLHLMELKEIILRKELGKKSKLPRGIFENKEKKEHKEKKGSFLEGSRARSGSKEKKGSKRRYYKSKK